MRHPPIDAGAYRWGHRQRDPRQQQPGRRSTGRTVNPPEACAVLMADRLPVSIRWERCPVIHQRLADTRAIADACGAPRAGPSVRAGVRVCGRCGRRLRAADGGQSNPLRSPCLRATLDDGAPGGLRLAGAFLEGVVAPQRMQGLQPASRACSVAAAQALRAARARVEAHGQQRLERARANAPRAARHDAAVEPLCSAQCYVA